MPDDLAFVEMFNPERYPEAVRIRRENPGLYAAMLANYRHELLMNQIVPCTMPHVVRPFELVDGRDN